MSYLLKHYRHFLDAPVRATFPPRKRSIVVLPAIETPRGKYSSVIVLTGIVPAASQSLTKRRKSSSENGRESAEQTGCTDSSPKKKTLAPLDIPKDRLSRSGGGPSPGTQAADKFAGLSVQEGQVSSRRSRKLKVCILYIGMV